MTTTPAALALVVERLRIDVAAGDTSVFSFVDRFDLTLRRGAMTALVGESGSGKSVLGHAILSSLGSPFSAQADAILVDDPGRRFVSSEKPSITRVAQDPGAALNPLMGIGDQIVEALGVHTRESRVSVRDKMHALLLRVGLTPVVDVARLFPHELSGGMQQRALLAVALASDPLVLIADEPTTSLDVNTENAILDVLDDERATRGLAVLWITHDLGLARKRADDVIVLYAGHVVERGPAPTVFADPRHPYSAMLLAARPKLVLDERPLSERRLPVIPGSVPSLFALQDGCRFRARCPNATVMCEVLPPFVDDGARMFRCHHPMAPASVSA